MSKERDLTELNKLEEYLKTNNYLYKRIDKPGESFSYRDGSVELINDRHQIRVYRNERDMSEDLTIWDVICHFGSYGCDEGLLEIMGYPVDDPPWGDDVEGYLQANDIIQLIENDKRRAQYVGQDIQEL